jgi:hypothetical protein
VEVKDLKYMVFGGFFLSVIRKNVHTDMISKDETKGLKEPIGHCNDDHIGNAVLVLADSRDPDLRMFDSKEYFEINFKTSTVSKFSPAERILGHKEGEDTGERCLFPMNDSTLFNIKEKGAKNIYMYGADGKPVIWKTGADELRVSPNGRNVVM